MPCGTVLRRNLSWQRPACCRAVPPVGFVKCITDSLDRALKHQVPFWMTERYGHGQPAQKPSIMLQLRWRAHSQRIKLLGFPYTHLFTAICWSGRACQTDSKLGIQYFAGSPVKRHKDSTLHKTILHRCRKIRLVTDNLSLRKYLMQILGCCLARVDGPLAPLQQADRLDLCHWVGHLAAVPKLVDPNFFSGQPWPLLTFIQFVPWMWKPSNLNGAARWTCGWIAQQPDSLTKLFRTLSEILVGRSFLSKRLGCISDAALAKLVRLSRERFCITMTPSPQ